MTKRIGFLPILFLLASGCAEEAEPTTDRHSAEAGWRSAEMALGGAGLATGWSGEGTVSPEGAQGIAMGTVDCPEGGTLKIDAVGQTSSEQVEGELSIEFLGCAADNVIIDGHLDYAGRVTQTEVTAEVHGDLTFSGEAVGTCAIDIEARVSADGTTASASVDGNLCGHAWSEVYG